MKLYFSRLALGCLATKAGGFRYLFKNLCGIYDVSEHSYDYLVQALFIFARPYQFSAVCVENYCFDVMANILFSLKIYFYYSQITLFSLSTYDCSLIPAALEILVFSGRSMQYFALILSTFEIASNMCGYLLQVVLRMWPTDSHLRSCLALLNSATALDAVSVQASLDWLGLLEFMPRLVTQVLFYRIYFKVFNQKPNSRTQFTGVSLSAQRDLTSSLQIPSINEARLRKINKETVIRVIFLHNPFCLGLQPWTGRRTKRLQVLVLCFFLFIISFPSCTLILKLRVGNFFQSGGRKLLKHYTGKNEQDRQQLNLQDCLYFIIQSKTGLIFGLPQEIFKRG